MSDIPAAQFIRFLQHYVPSGPLPVFWIGAGASAAAGYPTLTQLKRIIQEELGDSRREGDFIEAYVQHYSRVDLMNFLEGKFGEPRAFAPLHLAIVEGFMHGTKENSIMLFAPDASYPNRLRTIAAILAREGRAEESAKILDVLKAMGEDETLPPALPKLW
jgi:hypothetical protein